MESKISIFSVVDVIESLSGGTLLNGNLCMMDNSPAGSLNQGTPNLVTLCSPGETIHWTILALDLQTPVAIRKITFLNQDGTSAEPLPEDPTKLESDKLHLNVWAGIVPYYLVPGGEYRYRFELQMYEGKNCLMYVDTPALKII
ncbi:MULTISPECIES: hypothetical protein [Cyanophyceae]|uniref:Inclusion body protein n=1 Tax=Nodularia spumigena CENA596 TaxID=1819295 RepID=A0A161VTG4_NODSP|nr:MULTISPECIES: hypothetical protein [Cyanophyceae]MDB9355904.1 hypothetical protein [Nodularia spumigena CS-587/03]KZL50555.1 hypothetical protein A2T98_06695 [Nodularia spumigena CENA596]MDB9304197.1 hypothetical protein [Nodularia spumigena CS-591/12]MDB9318567.1 hypothetical protein [Nodularia spumigena CS-590/01A]MDB9320810.1 hypothetical protein [Nodularia spumigena CS-591/07A]